MYAGAAVKYVYDRRYAFDWPGHVFPTDKYRRTADALAVPTVAPESATREQLRLVHTEDYLALLDALPRRPELGIALFEVPCNAQTVEAFHRGAGGSILAGRMALYEGAAGNIGGGFHHAFADRGEGFCLINDLAVLVRALQDEGKIRSAAIIDCDVHQGNGTARVFAGDASVYTFSIHQEDNYPKKERSNLDIGLDDGTTDAEYLERLEQALPAVFDEGRPDLVVYQAGADPFRRDQLGGLDLSKEGLAARDRAVMEAAKRHGVPLVATLGGGYAYRTEDVVDIHAQTLRLLAEIWG